MIPNRIPACFALQEYNITPEDVVSCAFRCAPEQIGRKVVLMPSWRPETFSQWARADVVAEGLVWQLEYRGERITVIRSGIGAPLTGDSVLALGCTPCEALILTGSVGGLDSSQVIGDFILPVRALCGDGHSRYLAPAGEMQDCFLQPAEPDADLTRHAGDTARRLCAGGDVLVHEGAVFTSDTIMAQFRHLDALAREHSCLGIEMEAAAVFRAARIVGIRAAGLLQISDVSPLNKSVFSGRTPQENARRHAIRSSVLARAVLDSLISWE